MTRVGRCFFAGICLLAVAFVFCPQDLAGQTANAPSASERAERTAKEDAEAVMFRHGPSHSGIYDSAGRTNFAGLQWRFQTGGTVRSTPTPLRGVVYVGSSDGFLYAIDSRTGNKRWQVDTSSPITSTPAVANGRIYVATYNGRLLALDSASGRKIWSLKVGPDAPLAWGHESGDFFTASPTVYNDKIYYGGGDGYLYAVQAATGMELWKVKTGGRIRSSPAVEGDTVFFGSFDGSFYAVDASSGKLKWHYDTEGSRLNSRTFGFDRRSIQSSPAVADGAVFFGARDGFLYAVDANSGQLRWRFDHDVSWINSSPAVSDHMIYAGSSDAKFVNCVDVRTGKEVWRFNSDGLVWSSPAVAGRLLYVGDSLGNLYAIDRSSGKEAWRYRAQRRILSSPVIDDGKLYFGSDDGYVYAVNLSTKTALKRAVFWDANYVKGSSSRAHEVVRDYLKDNGYDIVNEQELVNFFRDRIADHAASVVVFAIDHLPQPVSFTGNRSGLLLEYLYNGGKVIWVGIPPLIWPRDLKTGERDFAKINRRSIRNLLSVSHERANFDTYTSTATAQGVKWGLSGWWLSNWGAEPPTVSTVLARDEQGLATAWVKWFAGTAGTGFVRIPLVENMSGEPTNLADIKIAAEYFPR